VKSRIYPLALCFTNFYRVFSIFGGTSVVPSEATGNPVVSPSKRYFDRVEQGSPAVELAVRLWLR
jgi:hypothetical protein